MKKQQSSSITLKQTNILGSDKFCVPLSSTNKFYGRYFKFARFFCKLFSAKYKVCIEKLNSPCVYVCRHKNLHSAITLSKFLPFDTHILALNVFFDKKTAFNHYYNYTFQGNPENKIIRYIKSLFCSIFVPPLIKSQKCVPVYREKGSLITIKRSINYLIKGESLLIFPDVDYFKTDGDSDIYDGFLYLEKLFFKKFGKHLNFVPIIIDDGKKLIYSREIIRFLGNEPFEKEKNSIKEVIKLAIFNKNYQCITD